MAVPTALPAAEELKKLPAAALAGLACQAAASGDYDGIRVLRAAGISMDVGTSYDHRTPLHLAAAAGDLKMVQFLIVECKAPMRRDRFGLLPINDAVQNGRVDVRRYLQSIKMEWAKEKAEMMRRTRCRAESIDSFADMGVSSRYANLDELMGMVFELVVKEGVFSYTTIYAEVSYFFKGLRLHPMYYEHFTVAQISKHVHCLIAAKRVAQATNDTSRINLELATETGGVFLTTFDETLTEAQKRTELQVASHLDGLWDGRAKSDRTGFSLKFMCSEGTLYKGQSERLGIFSTERVRFEAGRVSEEETSLEVLASSVFLKEKSSAAKEQYTIVMEDIVTKSRPVVNIVPGALYPTSQQSGFVVLFGTPETYNRTYFTEVWQALRFTNLCPRRCYLETFANGVIIYGIYLPSAQMPQVDHLRRALMFSTLLKTTGSLYRSVISGEISHEVGLYLKAGVKFTYSFYPREKYALEYMDVHQVLADDPMSQRKLESLYKLCMKDLLCGKRIFDLLHRHMQLAMKMFDNFRDIATGKMEPSFSKDLSEMIDRACPDPQDRQIMKMFLTFNESILLTNFFKQETPGAFAFRLKPSVVLNDRPATLYPQIPYGIYFISGRNFRGFHVRFRDVSRGGIRLVLSRDSMAYERNVASLFDEAYNLAFTQQMKNKDIPEGGSKGVILPDANELSQSPTQTLVAQRDCFTKYINSLLDCMLPEASGIFSGHMGGSTEMLFFGPDENTANFMDLGAELGRQRGYPYWKALTTGKSVKLGGVPHDTYGMTTASVHTYVVELLQRLGEDETNITKFQTGGPDGDLGSNEILMSKDKTICIVDGSGVLYDPAGLWRDELVRLAKARIPVKNFMPAHLSKDGFLVTIDETDVVLSDGSKWGSGAQLRDNFHLTSYARADLFVPCGGRPNSVTTGNVKSFFAEGVPKFRMVVEGANLFFSDGARQVLEDAGVHVFKDASTNKGGVCSSSLEVLAALALPDLQHSQWMTYSPDDTAQPPEFYTTYVQQILSIIRDNAKSEFKAIWDYNQSDGVSKVECTRRLSIKINHMSDSIQSHFREGMSPDEKDRLTRAVLSRSMPPVLLSSLGVEGILKRVPDSYIGALLGAWVGSKFVYRYGMAASEVSFFFFLRDLMAEAGGAKRPIAENGGAPAAKRQA